MVDYSPTLARQLSIIGESPNPKPETLLMCLFF